MREQIPEDWRPLFGGGPAMGLRKGELFALKKSDVNLDRGTITVARSLDRDTTKGGAGSGRTAAAPPLGGSRSGERATVIVPRSRVTSLFLSANNSPLRRPLAVPHGKRGRQ